MHLGTCKIKDRILYTESVAPSYIRDGVVEQITPLGLYMIRDVREKTYEWKRYTDVNILEIIETER
jgi:hypothetical protein